MSENIDRSFLCINSNNNHNDNNNNLMQIIIGNYKKYGGSCNIPEKDYYEYMDKIYKITKYSSIQTYKSYTYNNIEMCVDNKTKTKYFRSIYPIKSIIDKNYCINIYENTKIIDKNFPIINKYNNISKIKKNYTYKDHNNKSINIHFIEETKADKKTGIIRRVVIEFDNNNSELAKTILNTLIN